MITKIFDIAMPILAVLMSCVGYYFYIKSQAERAAAAAINKAEPDADDGKTGEEKLNEAVEQVYELIPASARVFIPKTVVRGIVQMAFDNIEEYAKKQVAKKTK